MKLESDEVPMARAVIMTALACAVFNSGAGDELLVKRPDTEEGRKADLDEANNIGLTCEMMADQILVRSGLAPVHVPQGSAGEEPQAGGEA